MADTLIRVERLTEAEQQKLQEARDKLAAAHKEVSSVKDRIAGAHKMKGEIYMEWRSWAEIEGEYILFHRRQN